MTEAQHDVIVTAGRVFCRETGLDGPGGVAVRDGRIVESGPSISGEAKRTLDFPDHLLLPGFVDMHAHPAPSDWKYGIDPDAEILPRGSTTVLSQGDAGPATWETYRRQIIEGSSTRVLMAISPALKGESVESPVFQDLADVDVDACVAAIRDGGENIWGIALNVGEPGTGGNDPREIMGRTLSIAERTGRPLLFGPRREPFDWPLADQLDLLRAGDVVTYCFHESGGLVDAGGRVAEEVWRARERGVLFDVGHGMSSFDFGVAEASISQGFLPDTISTDVYRRHLAEDPGHDMPRTVSKLMAAGMEETEALARATASPARALGLAGEVGTLAPGASADLAVLRWNPETPPLSDTAGATRPGRRWEPALTIKSGELVQPNG